LSTSRLQNPLSQADETRHSFATLAVSVYFASVHGRAAFRG
jgi:hypothetical protein